MPHVLLNCSAARRDFAFDPTPFPAWLKAYVEDFQRSRPRDLFRSTRPLEIALARQYLKMRLTM